MKPYGLPSVMGCQALWAAKRYGLPSWLRQPEAQHRRIGCGSYRFAELVLTAGLRTGTVAVSAAASLARRCARNRAVFRRVASSFSIYSFQAAAPAFACSSLRKSLLALRTAALSCSAI